MTSLPLESTVGNAELAAFWAGDDAYYVCADPGADGAAQWYRLDSGAIEGESTLEERMAASKTMADITPIGGGRVAFPVGSSGRRFYRVWRSGSASGRTRILAVRAGRSHRRPA